MTPLDRLVDSISEPALVADALAELVADVPAPAARRTLPPLRKVPPAPARAVVHPARKPRPGSRRFRDP
jgi:hypothetical protein